VPLSEGEFEPAPPLELSDAPIEPEPDSLPLVEPAPPVEAGVESFTE